MMTLVECKSWKVMMDQGLGSQRKLNILSLGLMVSKVVRCGSIATCISCFEDDIVHGTMENAHCTCMFLHFS